MLWPCLRQHLRNSHFHHLWTTMRKTWSPRKKFKEILSNFTKLHDCTKLYIPNRNVSLTMTQRSTEIVNFHHCHNLITLVNQTLLERHIHSAHIPSSSQAVWTKATDCTYCCPCCGRYIWHWRSLSVWQWIRLMWNLQQSSQIHKHMYRCCPYNKKLLTKYYLIQLIAHGSIATQLYRYDARWNQTKCW